MLDHLRHRARDVARRGIDRQALEVVARAVDEVAVLVDVEVAAAGEVVGAGEDRVAVRLADARLDDEEAGAVERHDRCRSRTVLTSPCTVLVPRDCASTAPADLPLERRVGDQIEEVGLDALVAGGLAVRDVARDVLEREGLGAKPGHRSGKRPIDAHADTPLRPGAPRACSSSNDARAVPAESD